MTLRTATPADLPIVLHHREAMFIAMGTPSSPDGLETSRSFFARAFAENRHFGWFVEYEGTAVAGGGIVLLEYQPQPAQPGPLRPFVVNMWTEPAYRGRGLARQLMQAMIEWSRREGYPVVNLHASDEGRVLYEKLGFLPTNEMRLRL
jgi:GNAT superfamily N-acetyltransferase